MEQSSFERQETRLAHIITEAIDAHPDEPYIQYAEDWWPWRSVASVREVLREAVARALPNGNDAAAIGVALRNRPQHVGALLSVLGEGHSMVTLSAFQPDQVLAEELVEMRLPVVIADEEDWARTEFLESAVHAGSVGVAIRTDSADPAQLLPELTGPARPDHYRSTPGVAIEMLTSGTTGRPKRVPLRADALERGILSDAAKGTSAGARPQSNAQVSILWNPLVHIAGSWGVISTVVFGMRLSLLERFDVQQFVSRVREHRPSVISLTPTSMRMVLDAAVDPNDFASVQLVRSGTARVPPELIDEFETKYGKPVIVTYGATEFAGAVTTWALDEWETYKHSKRGSSGRANPGFEIRVVDPATRSILPAGSEGILEVRAEEILGRDWIHTTDLAHIDEDGFLFVTGRADRAINRGGFKILPDMVVAALEQHPSVKEASVVGLADPRLGAVPVAAVEIDDKSPEGAPTPDDLTAFLRTRLLPYQVPTQIRIVPALPRTPSMKPSQPDVLALFQADHGTARDSS